MQRSVIEVKDDWRTERTKYLSSRRETVCSFGKETCTLVGEIKFSEFDEENKNPEFLESAFTLYEAAAVLARFTDLAGYQRVRYYPTSREWSSRTRVFGEEKDGLVIATMVEDRFEERHNKFIVGFFSGAYGELPLPLLEVRRYWVEHDPHKGSKDCCDRRYLLQIHEPSLFDILNLGPRVAYRTRKILRNNRGVKASSGFSLMIGDIPAGKRVFTLDEILKEPDVHEALKTIVNESERWKKKSLSVKK